MARSMRLFLIRHGETVDNVAQLYAGSRDSELTRHGYQQATRLGMHFQGDRLLFTHIFSSHLQRAAITASKIREAQFRRMEKAGLEPLAPNVVQLPLLMEQDFGSMEGKKWYDRPPEANVSTHQHNQQSNRHTVAFGDMESKDAMARRADAFIDEHLLPFFEGRSENVNPVIAIVSHGIFLSTLWKRLLLLLPPRSVALTPELQADARSSLEHLGSWSNTGYLELHMTQAVSRESRPATDSLPPSAREQSLLPFKALTTGNEKEKAEVPSILGGEVSPLPAVPVQQPAASRIAHGWTTTVRTINGKDHLKGLKRTGGGVGSSRYDASQKSIETFFKRRKVE